MALRLVAILLLLTSAVIAQTPPIRLQVDATDAPRRLIHGRLTFPVKPGPLTLYYPQWIPGEHAPTGPISDLANLRITAAGVPIPWHRDPLNMFAFRLDVPPNTTQIEVALDLISPPETGGFSSGSSATPEMAVLNWNQFLLYPSGTPTDRLDIQATLKVPAGWRYGTALPIASESGDTVQFKPSSLTTLIDSPVSTAAHYRTIDLNPGGMPPHFLHLAADSERALEITPEQVTHLKNLVQQTGALFGARHYRDYHFLLSLSDHIAHFGLEHHESSDDRIGERSLVDENLRAATADLLPHEFTHSWNGKYRRPAGLATPDYEKPMQGDLLWVYEGLTEYLGEVLTPRSGLWTPELYRDHLALTAAELDNEAGRRWRPLQDTATAAQTLYGARDDYADLRRGVDFYPESELIWLEADVLIRQLSKGQKSLDDFCRIFHGGSTGQPELKPYTMPEVVSTLNTVQPYDWSAFLHQRLDTTSEHAPLNGIVNSGWKLVYSDTQSALDRDFEANHKLTSFWYSLGFKVRDEGDISDVRVGSPAQKAGIAPAVKLVAVNNRHYNATLLRETIAAAAKTASPIELLIRDGDIYKILRVDYHAGERYPHLERDESKPDLLTEIIKPLP